MEMHRDKVISRMGGGGETERGDEDVRFLAFPGLLGERCLRTLGDGTEQRE
jgi:hypothetical protein